MMTEPRRTGRAFPGHDAALADAQAERRRCEAGLAEAPADLVDYWALRLSAALAREAAEWRRVRAAWERGRPR
jgi:hypothetical protein